MTFEEGILRTDKYGTTYSLAGLELYNLDIIEKNFFYISEHPEENQKKITRTLWLTYDPYLAYTLKKD